MAEDGPILSQSEYEHLLEEIHKLQARIAELTALRDDLVYHVCPSLRAVYDEKIVSLEREMMAASMYLRELQRTIEILQGLFQDVLCLEVNVVGRLVKDEQVHGLEQ